MSLTDNSTGLLLDKSDIRTIAVDLPILERTRMYSYIEERTIIHDSYGEVMFFGDWHLGAEGFSSRPFNSSIELLKKSNHMKVVLTGDYFENSGKSDYISDEVLNLDEQIDLFVETLKIIKNQVVAILSGNHDDRLTRYTGWKNYIKHYAEEAGIDTEKVYVGKPQRGINIFFKSGDYTYSAYGIHGSTGAWRNKNTQLKRMAVGRRHTLLFMGHVHQILWEPTLYLEPTLDENVNARLQYWLATGGYLKDASYAEAKSYPPSLVGSPIVRFFSDKNELDMWTLPYRSHTLSAEVEPTVKITKPIKRYNREGVIKCPVCSGVNLMSRGRQWNCKDCGKYFKKR